MLIPHVTPGHLVLNNFTYILLPFQRWFVFFIIWSRAFKGKYGYMIGSAHSAVNKWRSTVRARWQPKWSCSAAEEEGHEHIEMLQIAWDVTCITHHIRLHQIDFVFPVKGWLGFCLIFEKRRNSTKHVIFLNCNEISFTQILNDLKTVFHMFPCFIHVDMGLNTDWQINFIAVKAICPMFTICFFLGLRFFD